MITKLKNLKFLLSILVIIVIIKLIYEYNNVNQQDIVEWIHNKNLKAVQIYNERFTFDNWGLASLGEYPFHKCSEKRCYAFKPFKYVQRALEASDAVMVHVPNLFYLNRKNYKRNPKQLWLFYTMESQRRSFCSLHYRLTDLDDWFNLTATFKSDSHILMDYKQFKNWESIHLDWDYINSIKSIKNNFISSLSNQILKKSKKASVFWYVSNCETPSRRENYVNELIKYIDIDIYGSCSSKFKDSKPDPCKNVKDGDMCDLELFNSYKFYLAFENSLCHEYATEKYWKIYRPDKFLKLNIVPIVKGAKDYEYNKIALANSFINADNYNSAKSLAEYINYLNNNDTAYMEFYKSKFQMIDHLKNTIKETNFNNKTIVYSNKRDDFTPFCEICSKLHDKEYLNNHKTNKIIKISDWFNPNYECWDQDEPNKLFSWITKIFGYCI